jgi:hypothetical protein
MSVIPLDLQRRFEQRWAARFARQVPPAATKKHGHEKQVQQFSAHGKAKSKARRLNSAGLRSAPAA